MSLSARKNALFKDETLKLRPEIRYSAAVKPRFVVHADKGPSASTGQRLTVEGHYAQQFYARTHIRSLASWIFQL